MVSGLYFSYVYILLDLFIFYKFHTIYFSWTGDKALKELQESYISQQNFPILKELASKVDIREYILVIVFHART